MGRAVGGAQLSVPGGRARPETYVECQCGADGGFTICEANPNAKAPAPSTNLSYADAQKAFFKKRRKEAQAALDAETAAKSI